MTEKEFIILIKKSLPLRSRLDPGTDFNLKQVHLMIENYLKKRIKVSISTYYD